MSKILTVECDHDCIHKSQTKKEFQDPALESLSKVLKNKYLEMSENMISEIFEYLGLKSIQKGMNGHKYVKRTGGPGNYKYWYKLPNGRLVEGNDAPEGHKHHSSNDHKSSVGNTTKTIIVAKKKGEEVAFRKEATEKPKQNFGKVIVKPASAERKVTFNADIGGAKLQMDFNAADKSDVPFQSKHPSTNLVKEVRFGSTDNGTQVRLNNALQDAESVLASVDIKFKRALNFYCGYMDSKGGVNAAYSITNHNVGLHSDKTIEKSLMHEIGHAIDFSISKTSKTNVSHFAQAAMLPGPSLEKSIMEAVKLSPMYQEALKNPKRYEYLTQPTEMFARAFEVFALEKAKQLAREGKANQTFAKNYFPDVYKNITDPKQFQAMQKIATMMEELLKKTPIRKSVEWAP